MNNFDLPSGSVGLDHPKLQAIFKKHGISMDEFVDKLMKQSFKFDFDKEKDKLFDELITRKTIK